MASIEFSSQVIDLTAAVNVVSPSSPLKRLINRTAITIPPDATVADAAAAMEAAGVSALLVEGAGGVVTERDIARATAHGVPGDALVDAVATRYPLVVPGSVSVLEACGVMLNEHLRHLVVAIDGDRVGIVSLRDLAAVLLQASDPHLWLASLRIAVESPSEIWLG